MITKEQKQLIQDVKRESGTNEFLSVSDLIVRIEENYKGKGETLYYEDAGITFSNWNDFLRNTPLSMDLFIGEGAIFEGFERVAENKVLLNIDLDMDVYTVQIEEMDIRHHFKIYFMPYRGAMFFRTTSTLEGLLDETKKLQTFILK